MGATLIDICMATYNGGEYLAQQIDSIRSQSFNEWRLLVSDDGSSDDTIALINKYCGLDSRICNVSALNPFHSATKNFMYLLASSSSPYVMLCDQDDFWLPDKVELTLKKMNQLESLFGQSVPLLVFTDAIVVDSSLSVIKHSFVQGLSFKPGSVSLPQLLVSNVVQGCTVMVNRCAVLNALSSPIPDAFAYHDHWLAVTTMACGHIGFLKRKTLLYRQHENNVVGADATLNLFEKLANGLKRFLTPGSIRNAYSKETLFALRAKALLDSTLPVRCSYFDDLRQLSSFGSCRILDKIKLISRYSLLRDVGIYGSLTQLFVLLLGGYISND